ncbi:MarR family transcriptional regulator [Streptomyces verrucosisporus]|uniref:MarR family winged helix-turn-helix transcriptional regulator n=1 Tax=Streptomyces verrucosisporus TaxID=1695161 RepID=UPI0019D04A98|nr:MarR family transcriptional regulator [Streptomyces verrucosisporus]MBN3929565.1 MarR family transcriptional regulator [Streptomyces verrucosisporus]
MSDTAGISPCGREIMVGSTLLECPDMPDRLARHVIRLAQLLDAVTADAAEDAGLTRIDADVLLALYAAPGRRLSPTGLTVGCGLSSGGTSNIVHRLAAAGYVNREANLCDGRSSWVCLTEEGARTAGLVAQSAASARARLLRRLPEGCAESLTQLVELALDRLDDNAVPPSTGRPARRARPLGKGTCSGG